MAKSTTSAMPPTLDIQKDQWVKFLAEFTRENRGAHARLEVLGADAGYQVETENRPFEGIAADIKDRENTVWITLGSTPSDHHAHGVQKVTAIRVLPPVMSAGATLEIEAQDGTKTLLELTRPEDYALPPAAQHNRS